MIAINHMLCLDKKQSAAVPIPKITDRTAIQAELEDSVKVAIVAHDNHTMIPARGGITPTRESSIARGVWERSYPLPESHVL
jgi:hypothetical protein